MCMARFETGAGGNPHYHGFSVGAPGPVVKRVKADVDGEDDLPPQTVTDDVRVVRRAMRSANSSMSWPYDEVWSAEEVKARMRQVLVDEDDVHELEGVEAAGVGESDESDGSEERARVSNEEGRVLAVLKELRERGDIEELAGEGEGEVSDLRYRHVPPVPEVKVIEKRERKRGRPAGVKDGEGAERLHGSMADLGVLKLGEQEQQLQSSL